MKTTGCRDLTTACKHLTKGDNNDALFSVPHHLLRSRRHQRKRRRTLAELDAGGIPAAELWPGICSGWCSAGVCTPQTSALDRGGGTSSSSGRWTWADGSAPRGRLAACRYSSRGPAETAAVKDGDWNRFQHKGSEEKSKRATLSCELVHAPRADSPVRTHVGARRKPLRCQGSRLFPLLLWEPERIR